VHRAELRVNRRKAKHETCRKDGNKQVPDEGLSGKPARR
jgi:hypothetical protein